MPVPRVALETGDKSLLAIGIVEVVGDFDKGDVVGVRDPEGREFARGLSNYPALDARQIRGSGPNRPARPSDRRSTMRSSSAITSS